MTEITQEIILKNIQYCSESGRLYWIRPKKGRKLGVPIGKLRIDGRRELMINYKKYLTAHVVWIIHHGVWPKDTGLEIDHHNQCKSDDRIENLRLATHSENNHNRYELNGSRGVYKCGNKWRARIVVNGQKIHLGYFYSKEEARENYITATTKYFSEFACPW